MVMIMIIINIYVYIHKVFEKIPVKLHRHLSMIKIMKRIRINVDLKTLCFLVTPNERFSLFFDLEDETNAIYKHKFIILDKILYKELSKRLILISCTEYFMKYSNKIAKNVTFFHILAKEMTKIVNK